MLDIKKEAKGSALKITLEGRLDTTHALLSKLHSKVLWKA